MTVGAQGGGALDSYNGNFVFRDCYIADCSSARDGGCLYPNGGTIEVTDTIISNCTAGRYGGGIIATGTLSATFSRLQILDSSVTGSYDGTGGGGCFRGSGGSSTFTDIVLSGCAALGLTSGSAISTSVPLVATNLSVSHTCTSALDAPSVFAAADVTSAFAFREVRVQLLGCGASVSQVSSGFPLGQCTDGLLSNNEPVCGGGATCTDRPLVSGDTIDASTAIACTCEGIFYPKARSSTLVNTGAQNELAAYDAGCVSARRATAVADVTEAVRTSVYKVPNGTLTVVSNLTLFMEGTDQDGATWFIPPPNASWLSAPSSGAVPSSAEPQQIALTVVANVEGLPERLAPYQTSLNVSVDSMVDTSFVLPVTLSVTARTHLPTSSWKVASRTAVEHTASEGVEPCSRDYSVYRDVKVSVSHTFTFQACDFEACPVDHQLPTSTDARRLAVELIKGSTPSAQDATIVYVREGVYDVNVIAPAPGEFILVVRAHPDDGASAPVLVLNATCPLELGLVPMDMGDRCGCIPGTSFLGGACVPCRPGTFSDTVGSECSESPPGSYAPEGTAKPIPCRPGTFSEAPGISSMAECKPCPPGEMSLPGMTSCVPCGGTAPLAALTAVTEPDYGPFIPRGIDCTRGILNGTLPGFWSQHRPLTVANVNASRTWACNSKLVAPQSCLGGLESVCHEGHDPDWAMCARCLPGFYLDSETRLCAKSPDPEEGDGLGIIVPLAIGALMLLFFSGLIVAYLIWMFSSPVFYHCDPPVRRKRT